MRFLRQYRFIVVFFLLLIFCTVMWVRQINLKQSKHVEMREAFILLFMRNYTNEARHLFVKLVMEVPKSSGTFFDKQAMESPHEVIFLVRLRFNQTNNLIWRYHWML